MKWGGEALGTSYNGEVKLQLMKVKVNQLSYSQLALLIFRGATSESAIKKKILATKSNGWKLCELFFWGGVGCLETTYCHLDLFEFPPRL